MYLEFEKYLNKTWNETSYTSLSKWPWRQPKYVRNLFLQTVSKVFKIIRLKMVDPEIGR